MTITTSATLSDRRGVGAFLLGCSAVTAGVILHLPMFIASRAMGYRMAGMPMETGMLIGMALIVGGVAISAYGLLPTRIREQRAVPNVTVTAPEDAALGRMHWGLMLVLVVALSYVRPVIASQAGTVRILGQRDTFPGRTSPDRGRPLALYAPPFFSFSATCCAK